MVDEQQPAKKVVKRVVKRTVVRPPSAAPAPTVRYGRPVTGTTPRAKAAAVPPRTAAASATKVAAAPPVAKPARKPVSRPRLDLGAKVGSAARAATSRGSGAVSGVGGVIGSASRGMGYAASDRARAVRDWRIPHWDPSRSSFFTGAVVGLVSVGLGVGALSLFTQVRGVASGGGKWGSLAFVIVAVVAFQLGKLMLRAFGSTQAAATSLVGVVLAIVAILGLFLGVAQTAWAALLVPVLCAVTFGASQWVLDLAENSPTQPE